MIPMTPRGTRFFPISRPFGRDGSRIGYGGGYYDRFFSREPGHKKAGYCFSFQLFDQTPSGKYDEKMDLVITEDGIFEA